MQAIDVRRDWTPGEKQMFEDVAIGFLRGFPSALQTRRVFDGWLRETYPDMVQYADLVWSYVLAN